MNTAGIVYIIIFVIIIGLMTFFRIKQNRENEMKEKKKGNKRRKK